MLGLYQYHGNGYGIGFLVSLSPFNALIYRIRSAVGNLSLYVLVFSARFGTAYDFNHGICFYSSTC